MKLGILMLLRKKSMFEKKMLPSFLMRSKMSFELHCEKMISVKSDQDKRFPPIELIDKRDF